MTTSTFNKVIALKENHSAFKDEKNTVNSELYWVFAELASSNPADTLSDQGVNAFLMDCEMERYGENKNLVRAAQEAHHLIFAA